MQEFCNNRAKSFKNIWKIKKLVLSLHRFSLIKTSEGHAKVLEYFLKKVSKIFGGFRNKYYFCTAFPLQKTGEQKMEVLMQIRIQFFEEIEQLKFYPSLLGEMISNNTFEIGATI